MAVPQTGIKAKVQMISGCKDEQTSGDVGDVGAFNLPKVVGPGGAGGACTNSMMQTFYKNDDTPDIPDCRMTWAQVLVEMRQCLEKGNFSQVPQLSSSYKMPIGTPFAVKPPGARRTKAVLIGINYVGHEVGELSGCHNDVRVMRQFIISQGFDSSPERMRVLMDDGQNEQPTKANIEAAMKWLISDVQPGDALFLHFSGHGLNVPDQDGDEESGFDQALAPVDYQTAYVILDDWILSDIINPLPEGVYMFSVMDCCHSGSIMDLPYEIVVTPELAAKVEMIMDKNQSEADVAPSLDQGLQNALNSNADIGMKENPSYFKKYMKKHGGLLKKAAAAAVAGGAVGTVAGPVGTCIGCFAGLASVFCFFKEEAKALGEDVKSDAKAAAQAQALRV